MKKSISLVLAAAVSITSFLSGSAIGLADDGDTETATTETVTTGEENALDSILNKDWDAEYERMMEEDLVSEYDFTEGRYIREDGLVYMKVYYVDKKGANISLYDTDQELVWWLNYQPYEMQRVFEERFELTSKSEKRGGYKDSTLVYYPEGQDGSITVYIKDSLKKIHIEDNIETDPEMNFTGDYTWQPFVSGHTSWFERIEYRPKLIRVPWERWHPEQYVTDWEQALVEYQGYEDVEIEVPWTIKEPDKYVHETYEWDEESIGISLEKIAECMYTHFKGKAVIVNAEVTDDKKFERFYLNRDGEYCKNSEDEFGMLTAREKMLSGIVGNSSECEMLFYQDTENRNHMSGLYIQNGFETSTDVELSTGDLTMFYQFNDIDWSDVNANANYGYIVDEKNGTIELLGYANNKMDIGDFICSTVQYDITIYLNENGTVEAVGSVDCYGLGSEHIKYMIFGNADDFQINTEEELKWKFVSSHGVIETEEYIPGEEITTTKKVTVRQPVSYFEIINIPRIKKIPGFMEYGWDWKLIWEKYVYWYAQHVRDIGLWPKEEKLPFEDVIIIPIDDPDPDAGDGGGDAFDNGGGSGGSGDVTDGYEIPPEFYVVDRPSEIVTDGGIKQIAATSGLWNQGAEKMVDGNLSSCWVEGVQGTGAGEEFIAVFDGFRQLRGIAIANGCFASQRSYEENGKITRLKITYADGLEEYWDLETGLTNVEDVSYSNYAEPEREHYTNFVRFTIESAEPGSKYEDTCVSGLYFTFYD